MDSRTLELVTVTAPNLAVPHAFMTRQSGVSRGAFEGLNLGLSSGDDPAKVEANRRLVMQDFGVTQAQVCAFDQVHGKRVLEATPQWFTEEADAAVTNQPDLLLVVSVADCLPVLYHDPVKNVVGAAHCGWRGTVQGLAAEVLERMRELYGSDPADVRVAFGAGIGGDCYQVGAEVVKEFQEAGFPESVYRPDDSGRYRLDIAAANRYALLKAGVRAENLWDSGLCTHCEPERFYSYRRDKGTTGRHWAVIKLPNPSP